MTPEQLQFLKTQIDQVVVLDLTDGRRMLAQILIVVDEGETPDLFCLEVVRTPDGYVQQGANGHSILLSEIESVESAPVLSGPNGEPE